MDKFGGFLNPTCREGHLCLMGLNGREIFIRIQSKGEYIKNCSISNTHLIGQDRSDYIRFTGNCREGYDIGDHTQKWKSG